MLVEQENKAVSHFKEIFVAMLCRQMAMLCGKTVFLKQI